MVINGLSGNGYFINNPIEIEITQLSQNTSKVAISVTNNGITQTNNNTLGFLLKPFNQKAQFDLSDVLKALMLPPKHPKVINNGAYINTNYLRFKIDISELDSNGNILSTQTKSKIAVRGGKKTAEKNIAFLTNLSVDLKEDEKIPRWAGFPAYKYTLDPSGIKVFSIIPNSEVEFSPISTCEKPLYFRWLNTKGGYSFWLFEVWEMSEKAGKTELVNSDFDNTGLNSEIEITAKTRVQENYYNTLQSLITSPEVYVYRFNNGLIWERVRNESNQFKRSVKDLEEIQYKFTLETTHNPYVKW